MTAIFEQLNETIRFHGGVVSSVPGTWPMRYSIEPSAAEKLSKLLADAGWRPQSRGSTTQVGYAGLVDALVYEIGKPREAR